MKKTILWGIGLCMLFFANNGMAQTIKGTVTDTTSKGLANATVVILQASDSVMLNFAFTAEDGSFELKRIREGEYLLQISYIGYKSTSKPIAMMDGVEIDLGEIALQAVTTSLDEVEIAGERTPIELKGDTIQYNADAFQARPNAMVEDLLKKLPGVEVESDGSITAQGESVQRILVDGKEFFGTDPKIASRNLPADAVDNVQVFDRLSEMAEFSGVDDGEREKTINLSLKEDKKKGVFGTATAGYGTEDRYGGRFSINRFNNKLQMSAIGMFNNTNEQGFSIGDFVSFMGGLQNMMARGGGRNTFRQLGAGGNVKGIPISNGGPSYGFTTTGAGGLNLNYDMGKKTDLNISYFFNGLQQDIDQEVFRTEFLNNRVFDSEERSVQDSRNFAHTVNLRLEHEIDSFSKFILRSNLSYNDAMYESSGESVTLNSAGTRENSSEQKYDSEGENLNFGSQLTYMRKFRKRGRTFVVDGRVSGLGDETKSGNLFSLNSFFPDDPIRAFADTVNQRQNDFNNNQTYRIRLSYSEPIGRNKYLEANYTHQRREVESKKDVYDREALLNPTEILNPELSNHYVSDYIYDRAGLNFRIANDKINFTPGLYAMRSTLDGDLLTQGVAIERKENFFLLPALQLRWNMAEARNLRFEYRTNVNEPSLTQLQPIVDNSNPLNVYIGNPDLIPEYRHTVETRFLSFDQFSFTNIFASVSATYTQNKIANASLVDSLFRRITTPINVDRDLSLRGFVNFATPIRPINSRISISGRMTFSNGIVFVNNIENTIDRLTPSINVRLENRNKDVIDIAIGTNQSFTKTQYSVSSEFDQTYNTGRYYVDFNVRFLKTFLFATSFNYTVYGGQAFSDQEEIPIWQASLSKYVMKNDRGELKLVVNDILNRNLGVSRSSQLNYIEDQRIISLGRYFFVSFTYNLSKFPNTNAGGPPPGMRMFRRGRG